MAQPAKRPRYSDARLVGGTRLLRVRERKDSYEYIDAMAQDDRVCC